MHNVLLQLGLVKGERGFHKENGEQILPQILVSLYPSFRVEHLARAGSAKESNTGSMNEAGISTHTYQKGQCMNLTADAERDYLRTTPRLLGGENHNT